MTRHVAVYLLVYYEQNMGEFTHCATLTQTTCLAQEIAHTIIKFTHQLCNIKYMLINITHYLYTPLHYLYEWSSKNQRQQMKIWCIYSHHSYILSLSYHKFTHSRLSYPKQYKETWHATTSLSTPPSSQHHLAGIAVVSCLLFIHTTSLVIHITYGHFAAHHMRLVI